MKNGKKLGLALGSGGAKGFALVGALKAFEEINLKFDCVAGTSIGSVVGALYACGYTPSEMLSLLGEFKLDEAKSLVNRYIGGLLLEKLFDGILGGKTFDDMLLPFKAVAVNLDKGTEVVFDKGDLSTALACSCAIPPVFRPIVVGGDRIVDGAFMNAVPADVVKNTGADVVVSICLSQNSLNDDGKLTLDAMYPDNKVPRCDRLKKMREFSDVTIRPKLDGYTSTSIAHAEEIFASGYLAVRDNLDLLKNL